MENVSLKRLNAQFVIFIDNQRLIIYHSLIPATKPKRALLKADVIIIEQDT